MITGCILTCLFHHPLPRMMYCPYRFGNFIARTDRKGIETCIFQPDFSYPTIPFGFSQYDRQFFSGIIGHLYVRIIGSKCERCFLTCSMRSLTDINQRNIRNSSNGMFQIVQITHIDKCKNPLFTFPLFQFIQILWMTCRQRQFIQ